MTIQIEKAGRRFYLIGNTFAIKDQLRAAGCNWDGERRAWWTSKSEVAERFAGEVKPVEKTESEKADERSRMACTGKALYKGRSYYIIGTFRDGQRFLLTTLDCSIEFWADRSEASVVKTYEPKERWSYGRRPSVTYQTVGNIRRFIEDSRRAESEIKRGIIPDGYCVDMEDGIVKRRHECDMPSN